MIELKKIKLTVFVLFLFYIAPLNAENYNEIKVNGNQRLSVETIIMFSGLKTEVDIKKEDLNRSIKNLYKTN